MFAKLFENLDLVKMNFFKAMFFSCPIIGLK